MKTILKKFTGLFLALSILVCMSAGCASAASGEALQTKGPQLVIDGSFSDVPEDAWYAEWVRQACEAKLMAGVGGTRFAPKSSLTRAMFVTILYRFTDRVSFHEHLDEYERFFSDTPEGKWYLEPALWAALNGITAGAAADSSGNALFCPNRPITRQDAAVMLWKYLTEVKDVPVPEEYLEPCPDEAEISGYAKEAVWGMRVLGLMQGDAKGRFLPRKALTRAEAAVLAVRLLKLHESFGPVTELSKGYTAQTDPDETALTAEARAAITDACMAMSRKAMTEPNSVFSPLSVLYALGMTANGAKGQTLEQLEAAFGLPLADCNPALAALQAKLTAGNTELSETNLANSIWISDANDFTVPEAFLQTNANFYGAQVFRSPFDQAGVQAINSWIAAQTNGRIRNMLEELPEQGLCLVNALYLNAQWTDPYWGTTPGTFTNADGTVRDCDLLRSVEHTYLEDDCFTGFCESLYGGYRFVGLLPREDLSLNEALAALDGARMRNLLGTASYAYEVHTAMPKVHLTGSFDLRGALQQLGIRDLFTYPAADLSGMGSEELFVAKLFQKADFELDENGVSAAAATVVLPVPGAPEPGEDPIPVKTVELTRPYLFLIVDGSTGIPLFVGSVDSLAD